MYLQVLIVSFMLVLLGALLGFLGFPLLFEELVKQVSQEETLNLCVWKFKKPFLLTECESQAGQRDASAVAAATVSHGLQDLRLQCDQCTGGGGGRYATAAGAGTVGIRVSIKSFWQAETD